MSARVLREHEDQGLVLSLFRAATACMPVGDLVLWGFHLFIASYRFLRNLVFRLHVRHDSRRFKDFVALTDLAVPVSLCGWSKDLRWPLRLLSRQGYHVCFREARSVAHNELLVSFGRKL